MLTFDAFETYLLTERDGGACVKAVYLKFALESAVLAGSNDDLNEVATTLFPI